MHTWELTKHIWDVVLVMVLHSLLQQGSNPLAKAQQGHSAQFGLSYYM